MHVCSLLLGLWRDGLWARSVVLGVVLAKACLTSYGQAADSLTYSESAYAVVANMVVEGNRKTRAQIVLREMSIGFGDTVQLAQLPAIKARQRQLLLNTSLFSEAQLIVSTLDTAAHLMRLRVVVREKWYFYPGIEFDLADRNFNVWWTEQNHALDRINYGLKFRHSNITGRADRLSLLLQAGYTRKAEIRYSVPYINRAQTLGVSIGILTDRNREWWVRTDDARLDFLDLDSLNVLNRQRYQLSLTYQPAIYHHHEIRLQYQANRVDSMVAHVENPNFFGSSRETQRFFSLRYQYTLDKRDVRPFPLNGYLLSTSVEKLGLMPKADINRLQLGFNIKYYLPLLQRFNLALDASGRTDLVRTRVPYFNRVSLGFKADVVRGYQFYVVDGLDYAFLKSTLRYKVFQTKLSIPIVPILALKNIPFQFHLGIHGDVGGANDPYDTPGNVLANQVLKSAGVGAYAVLFYGKVIQFELTRNDLGETGAFFSYSLGF